MASIFFQKKTRHKKYQQNLKFFSLWYGAVWVGTEVCKSGLRVLLVKFYGFRDKAFFVFRGFPGTLKGCKSGLNFFFQKKTRHKKYQINLKFFSLWYGAVWVGTLAC